MVRQWGMMLHLMPVLHRRPMNGAIPMRRRTTTAGTCSLVRGMCGPATAATWLPADCRGEEGLGHACDGCVCSDQRPQPDAVCFDVIVSHG